MKPKTLKEFVSEIDMPIRVVNTENPRQLVLAKNGDYVASYDPVWKLEVDSDGGLVITGWLNKKYEHKAEEFDRVLVYRYQKDLPYREEDVLQAITVAPPTTDRTTEI